MTKLNGLTFQPVTGALLNILRQAYLLNIIKQSLLVIGKLCLIKNTRESGTKFIISGVQSKHCEFQITVTYVA